MSAQKRRIATHQINDAIDLIGDIAGQTNAIALNAVLETAQNAETEKSFLEAANEAKLLANQTATASEVISNQIGALRQQAKTPVEAILDISRAVDDIDESVAAIEENIFAEDLAGIEAGKEQNTGERKLQEETPAPKESHLTVLDMSTQLGNRTRKLTRDINRFLDDINPL